MLILCYVLLGIFQLLNAVFESDLLSAVLEF